MSKNILIVDDDNELRDILSEMFSLEGYNVFSAINGRLGLDLIRKEKLDIVLLDVAMPVMNGTEVLKAMKNENLLDKVAVYLFSGHANDGELHGARGLIKKPADIDTILQTINKESA